MNKKQGRRNLRHARIGQPDSNRRYLKTDDVKSRLLCIEIHLPEDEDPVDIYFRPIPTSRVFSLRGLTGDTALNLMLNLLSDYVVDPETGERLDLTPGDWDKFGGAQPIVQGMIDASMGTKNQNTEAGPTTTVHSDAMVQAALEVMQGDPEIASAFRKASAVILDQEKQTTEVQMIQESQTEPNEGKAEVAEESAEIPIVEGALPTPVTFRMPPIPEVIPETEDQNQDPTSVPNGTSGETLSSDSPSSSTAT